MTTLHARINDYREAYDDFYARAGTYEIEPGNVYVERDIVAKNSLRMVPGSWVRWSYRLDGDTFSMTAHSNSNSNGRIANPGTWTFRRVVEDGEARLSTGVAGTGQSSDALLGTWRNNIAKSTYSPGPSPKNSTIVKWERSGSIYKHIIDNVDPVAQLRKPSRS